MAPFIRPLIVARAFGDLNQLVGNHEPDGEVFWPPARTNLPSSAYASVAGSPRRRAISTASWLIATRGLARKGVSQRPLRETREQTNAQLTVLFGKNGESFLQQRHGAYRRRREPGRTCRHSRAPRGRGCSGGAASLAISAARRKVFFADGMSPALA